MCGKEVRSLLQLSERLQLCHIWLFGRMKFASLEVNLSLGQGLSVNIIILFKEDPKHD